jgi:hypothetical protein
MASFFTHSSIPSIQHKRIHGVKTRADQRVMQMLDKPDDLVASQAR